jgi:hypothetical protein
MLCLIFGKQPTTRPRATAIVAVPWHHQQAAPRLPLFVSTESSVNIEHGLASQLLHVCSRVCRCKTNDMPVPLVLPWALWRRCCCQRLGGRGPRGPPPGPCTNPAAPAAWAPAAVPPSAPPEQQRKTKLDTCCLPNLHSRLLCEALKAGCKGTHVATYEFRSRHEHAGTRARGRTLSRNARISPP